MGRAPYSDTSTLDSNGASTGMPWWLTVLFKYGLGALLALWLTFWLTQSVDGDLKAQAEEQRKTYDVLMAHEAEMHADGRVQGALLHAICLNIAHTADARALCEVGQ